MTISVRRLRSGDEAILELLARDDADFDLDDRGGGRPPLSPEAARAYLADSNVLHWIAEKQGVIVGHMHCTLVRKFAGDPAEILLYEIGVRSAHRRQRVGRSLMNAMDAYMQEHGLKESWVLADNPGAVAFYRACGFKIEKPEPVYLLRPGDGDDADA